MFRLTLKNTSGIISNGLKNRTNIVRHASDLIQYQQLTSERLQDAVLFMETEYYTSENVSKVVRLSEDPAALLEMRELTTTIAKDGLSVIAIDQNCNKIVGTMLNKIHVSTSNIFEDFAKSCKRKSSKAFAQFNSDIDAMYDFFQLHKCGCVYETMFLGTSAEYRGKGIGRKLYKMSVDIGKNLVAGIDLERKPRPELIVSVCTTIVTQKISEELGFRVVFEKSYDELEYEGKKFSEILGNETTMITVECI